MGIVQNQAFKNTITTYVGFGIGAINILFLFTHFLTEEYFGLVAFVLSTANIMMPLFALGAHNALIKFYSSFSKQKNLNSFLTLILILPLFIIVPFGLLGYFAYEWIAQILSNENAIIKDYVWLIFVVAICFSYFEVFYAWSKVQMRSVFGNFMKEVFHRIGTLLLFAGIYMNWLDVNQFLYFVVIVYAIRTIVMMLYAFNIQRPIIRFGKVPKFWSIIKYALLIIIAGSVANIILEIDKFMIGELKQIENVAYYGVAIYIATVIGVPARSMHQITNPVTAMLLNENDSAGLADLYKKTSLNLFIISGLIFLVIVLNIDQLYLIIPDKYSGGIMVVFIVGLAKLSDNLAGNSSAILFNSDYYRVVLFLGVILALITILLNLWLIPIYGIEGAAYATFISILFYNVLKMGYVYYKFRISPFSKASLKTFCLLVLVIGLFYFWNFSFHPIVNIGLKSLLITGVYTLLVYILKFSDDISNLIDKALGR